MRVPYNKSLHRTAKTLRIFTAGELKSLGVTKRFGNEI